MNLELKGKEYAKINPNKTVPALALDNNKLLKESLAIMRYLIRSSNNKALLGEGL